MPLRSGRASEPLADFPFPAFSSPRVNRREITRLHRRPTAFYISYLPQHPVASTEDSVGFQPPYLVASKNLAAFLDALRNAQAPEKVSVRFIEQLGFKSTNDRLFIPLLKAMRFVDEAGKPTSRYHAFLDDSEWKRVLADGIREAYGDLFRVNKNAQTFSKEQLTGKLKSLGEGQLSPAVLANSVRTFMEAVKLADFSSDAAPVVAESTEEPGDETRDVPTEMEAPPSVIQRVPAGSSPGMPTLVYRIEIVLPAVRDQAVYDAIFRSARDHLLR